MHKVCKMNKSVLFLGLLAITFTACKKEDPDMVKPVITVNQPASDQMDVRLGENFSIQATITDDVELSQWKINIHSADGHTHRIMAGEWELTETGVASGKSYSFSKTVTVPNDAELGEYHYTVEATDKAGNAAVPVIIELHLE